MTITPRAVTNSGMHSRMRRRGFVGSVVGGLAGLAIGEGCASKPAPAPAGLIVIDTHTHFYDPARPQGVPWPPRNDPLLYRTILPGNYLSLPARRKVAGTVVVEASPWVEDNQWVLDLAAHEPFIAGLVGNLPIGQDGFNTHLQRFAANPLFRGLRARDVNLPAAVTDAAFVADLKRLAARDLSLDLVGGQEILPAAVRLAQAVPDLRVVLDHLAGLRVDGKTPPAEWRRLMESAARCPRVYAKVSGLVEGTGRNDGSAPGDVEFYRPVLDALWEVFGPDRLIYGSDWPVSERFAPLATVQAIVEDYFAGRGREALEKVFSRNAAVAYRWVKRPPG